MPKKVKLRGKGVGVVEFTEDEAKKLLALQETKSNPDKRVWSLVKEDGNTGSKGSDKQPTKKS